MSRNRYNFIVEVIILCIFLLVPTKVVCQEVLISAEAAVLIDGTTGEVLFSLNEKEARPPASTTKILTAIIAIEQGNLSEIASISKRSAQTGEASLHLVEGEKMSLENLLYGALLKSGNDACVAIAEHISPTVEEFVGLMNLKARILGCNNSHFVNTNGLPHKNHYSSALDLAIITRYALQNPTFAKIVRAPSINIEWENSSRRRLIKNTNRLLTTYSGATGVKTGTTVKAGQCLVASAEQEGRTLIAVVLKSKNRFLDAQKLLDYGFNNYYNVEVLKENQQLKLDIAQDIIFRTKDGLVITERKDKQVDITYEIDMDKAKLKRPFKQVEAGRLIIYNNGKRVGVIPIIAEDQRDKQQRDYLNNGIWDIIRNRLDFGGNK